MKTCTKLIYSIIVLLLWSGAIFGQQFQVQKIKDSGSASSKVNIVILADGYTSSQQSKFWSDVQDVTNGFFSREPYRSLSNRYNVYAVGAISSASGAGSSPSNPINNYFGSVFYYDGVTQRLLYPTNASRVWSVAGSHVPQYDVVVVLVNTSQYGGAGGAFACLSTHAQAVDLFAHEFGHTFGTLHDEYWNGNPSEAPNMTRSGSSPRWSQFIGQSGVGVYPHAENSSWYRPHQNCKMRYLSGNFCLVCSDALTQKTYDNSDGGDGCTTPSTPGNLSASGSTVSWSSVSGATRYTLQRWTNSSWSTVATPTGNSATLNLTGSHYFQVAASNSCGSSSYSAYAYLTLGGGGCTDPSVPTGLSSTGQYVVWNQVSGASSYNLQYWTGSSWVTIAQPTTTYAAVSLTGNYYFHVAAVNACGVSNYSAYSYLYVGPNGTPEIDESGEIETDLKITFYPNPTDGLVNINHPYEENMEVKIFNISGVLIAEDILYSDKKVVDISHLNEGVYILNLMKSDEVVSSIRVQKQ